MRGDDPAVRGGPLDDLRGDGGHRRPAREDALFDADNKILWYKMSVGSGGLLGQCFECMRVCPIANQAPMADPIRRFETALQAED